MEHQFQWKTIYDHIEKEFVRRKYCYVERLMYTGISNNFAQLFRKGRVDVTLTLYGWCGFVRLVILQSNNLQNVG